jgi:hypothetical protein
MRYPIRCIIVDVDGMVIMPDIVAVTPEVSGPHIGKHGLAEMEGEFDVKITLDDGSIIHGYECWWIPEEQEN